MRAEKHGDTAAVARLAFASIEELTGSSSSGTLEESCGSCEEHPAVRLALAKQGIDLSRRIIAWADRERGLWCYRNAMPGDPPPDSSGNGGNRWT